MRYYIIHAYIACPTVEFERYITIMRGLAKDNIYIYKI